MNTDNSAPNAQSTGLEDFKQKIQNKIQKLTEKQDAIETRHQNILDRQAALATQNGGTDASPSDIIRLNVCGTEMFARRDTLTAVKGSRLAALFSGRWESKLLRDEKNRVFMDVDPAAFRKLLDYLYTYKLVADGKYTFDLPSDTADLIEFFKLGEVAKKEDIKVAAFPQKDQDEHAMLDEMTKNLDVLEKQLEDEESFVSYFTKSADEDVNSEEPKQSGSDTDQVSFVNIEKGPIYNGIVTLFINGDILRYRTSTLSSEKDCKIAKDILDIDWINEHTIVTDQGRKCILMEYPREPLKKLLAYFQSKMMLGNVSGKGFDLFGAEYSISMMASIFPPDNAILQGWAFDEGTVMTFDQKKMLQQWMVDTGGSKEPTLLYRASRDGWNASDFHRHCDNKGNTIVVAKSLNDGAVFGGYTDAEWQASISDYRTSFKSFLFVLSPNPIKMKIMNGCESTAIYNNISYGPIFGEGEDFLIQGSESTSNLGNTYDCPYNLDSESLSCELADYEVYQV